MSATDQNGSGVDVLIAEDNEVNQMVFSFIMEELGYTFEIAANGEEAVAKYAAMKPPMIIMDVSMPVMNGFEATRKIRELESASGERVVIIAATAHALKGDSDRCLEAGMNDYIAKPISPDKLKVMMERWSSGSSMAAVTG